ncbi:UFD1-domain-containing protein [Sistotremastrum suecicum HHB10207 ss-3]|uniref:UFD1-domain-containing protein n=1 Tax=Sistotremastrum suecicum HHB10207 ss-3 TaxID=1314776 RepID=A0A166FNJ7_9AGAM|nr:UFD1-domain-containing protein [Sistotremastrum suecicum HHB10207 ss-3]
MFGGQDPFGAGPAGLFNQLAQGFQGPPFRRGQPRQYDEFLKAYSVAMLPGKERLNVSYGGKIIMPPSALASLTELELESPWMFELRNPSNPAASTHAGVLEFIAEEGVVHLPYWMMKTLRLNEGDPIRITGAQLPKGKLVKLQPQTVDFLEVSDPKAVLEQALRNFTALTQGDIIEISYNSITFSILIMEIQPAGPGISIFEVDLSVDFAAPKGYVEPKRPAPAPPPTMASKLNIDVNGSTPGSSRPGSALSGAFAGTSGGGGVSKNGQDWEAFKGKGESLTGRKTKGKGVSVRKIEDQQTNSKIYRTGPHIISNETLQTDAKAPAPLNLPFGKLFFGYNVVPHVPTPEAPKSPEAEEPQSRPAFTGSGNTLTGPSSRSRSNRSTPAPQPAPQPAPAPPKPEHDWGKGHSLSNSNAPRGAAKPPSKGKQKARERSPTPDWGVDDDDVIMIDSD